MSIEQLFLMVQDDLKTQGIPVAGLSDHSQEILEGQLFISLQHSDSLKTQTILEEAIRHGATAIFAEHKPSSHYIAESNSTKYDKFITSAPPLVTQYGYVIKKNKVPCWTIPNLKKHLASLASCAYSNPSSKLQLIGITGTNGKTSSSHWLAYLLEQYGYKAGIIGTLGHGLPGNLAPDKNTTPGTIKLNNLLNTMSTQRVTHVAMEVSSIGISEKRIEGLTFRSALFTNLSQDHLDYHSDMEAYAQAKISLFRWNKLESAIINLDDSLAKQLLKETLAKKIVGYRVEDGKQKNTQLDTYCHDILIAQDLKVSRTGVKFSLQHKGTYYPVACHILGRFNVYNILGVLSILTNLGVPLSDATVMLNTLPKLAGRLEIVTPLSNKAPLVIVDYAHTPDALNQTLDTIREITSIQQGQLWCIFGCGGNRDKTKRPLMGKIAISKADHVVLTSDNPRYESPHTIVEEIRSGIPNMPPSLQILLDRREAIRNTIHSAHDNDIVLITGKGHELYQEIKGIRHPFSDTEEARHALASKKERTLP